MNQMTEHRTIELAGCNPVPLAHYLKALGVFRLVAEQRDPEVRAVWHMDRFQLQSEMDADALTRFFLHEYRPTPIIAPWNGGSGFYPKDRTDAVGALISSANERFSPYADLLAQTKGLLRELGLTAKPKKSEKERLLKACRGRFPDLALEWLDAVFVLTDEGAKYPPLLGTGGNDGRLEFTNNFMQRLCVVFDPTDGSPAISSGEYLSNSLFGTAVDNLIKGAIGQFYPSAVGGMNASSGFDADSLINPWDYILMMEGSLLFGAALAKKAGSGSAATMSYPFSVRTVGVGYGSSSLADESASRAEFWVPLWERSVSYPELSAVIAEGRVQIGRRMARNGVDFARAIAALGVDRGLAAFQRFGFQQRNGRSYFAIPLDRFTVKRQPQIDLLMEIDGWLGRFRRKSKGKNAPSSAARASQRLDRAILDLCKREDPINVLSVLVALGECERVLATSSKWTQKTAHLRPIAPLSPKWLAEAYDNTTEFRLAAALASLYGRYVNNKGRRVTLPLRAHLEPCRFGAKEGAVWANWTEDTTNVVWKRGDPVGSLQSIFARRLVLARRGGKGSYEDRGRVFAEPEDIADFIEGRCDLARLEKLVWGLSLINWPRVPVRRQQFEWRRRPEHQLFPDASYSLMKCCFSSQKLGDERIPLVPPIFWRTRAGNLYDAVRLAQRRLRASGLAPLSSATTGSPEAAVRMGAALIFPISDLTLKMFTSRVLRPGTGSEAVSSEGAEGTERDMDDRTNSSPAM